MSQTFVLLWKMNDAMYELQEARAEKDEAKIQIAKAAADEAEAAYKEWKATKADEEKASAIASIPRAPEDGKNHPTPEMYWNLFLGRKLRPEEAHLENLEILDKKAILELPWGKEIDKALQSSQAWPVIKYKTLNECIISFDDDGELMEEYGHPLITVRNNVTGAIEFWQLNYDNLAVWGHEIKNHKNVEIVY